ncbi:hypothetical protein AMTRI_Chr04g251730 [Amborella trichopoda]
MLTQIHLSRYEDKGFCKERCETIVCSLQAVSIIDEEQRDCPSLMRNIETIVCSLQAVSIVDEEQRGELEEKKRTRSVIAIKKKRKKPCSPRVGRGTRERGLDIHKEREKGGRST